MTLDRDYDQAEEPGKAQSRPQGFPVRAGVCRGYRTCSQLWPHTLCTPPQFRATSGRPGLQLVPPSLGFVTFRLEPSLSLMGVGWGVAFIEWLRPDYGYGDEGVVKVHPCLKRLSYQVKMPNRSVCCPSSPHSPCWKHQQKM